MEEPREPLVGECRLKVIGGRPIIDEILDQIKKEVYKYNSTISSTGYYLKPVHKVYKRTASGKIVVYEYYGKYWWRLMRRGGKLKWIYVGKRNPPHLPEPPQVLDGVIIIKEGDDVIVECDFYDKYKGLLKGLKVIRV